MARGHQPRELRVIRVAVAQGSGLPETCSARGNGEKGPIHWGLEYR